MSAVPRASARYQLLRNVSVCRRSARRPTRRPLANSSTSGRARSSSVSPLGLAGRGVVLRRSVKLSPLVEKLGFVLPSRNGPHSGWPYAAHPSGSLASSRMSAKPIGVCRVAERLGHRLGHGDHERREHERLAAGGDRRLPWSASRWFTMAPHALAAGDQITGCGAVRPPDRASRSASSWRRRARRLAVRPDEHARRRPRFAARSR